MSLLLGVLALQLASAADATIVARRFNITSDAYGFGSGDPEPRPLPLALNVTLRLDTSVSVGPSISGLTVNSFNLPSGVTYGFNSANGILSLATAANVGGCAGSPGSFCIFMVGAFGASPNIFFSQQITPTSGTWFAVTNVVTYQDVGVPEPATWAMLLSGFAAVGGSMRLRRTSLAKAR